MMLRLCIVAELDLTILRTHLCTHLFGSQKVIEHSMMMLIQIADVIGYLSPPFDLWFYMRSLDKTCRKSSHVLSSYRCTASEKNLSLTI